MNKIHFLLGGVRSGKSRAAQALAEKYNDVLYVATANAKDEGMSERVRRHQADRPGTWQTLEAYRDFAEHTDLLQSREFVIVDCMTLMISRLMFEQEEGTAHFEWSSEIVEKMESKIFSQVEELLDAIGETPCAIVSNEVGLGVVPESWLGNYFRDIAGRINQFIAARAAHVTFLIAGLPMTIKGGE